MKCEFSEKAREEFLQSVDYYELQQSGLGLSFTEQIFATIERILDFPEGWTSLDADFHRCLVKQFPFAIIYTLQNDVMLVVSVMNLYREPGYWKNRTT
ncbi:MAG: type II toxin-antitoxin system RelE/ParE family toxin [Pontiellaceae bacterium]|nr:type II toxin-antitoxin system RelE/ParE family toxin [Pontiellaceae bacterium]